MKSLRVPGGLLYGLVWSDDMSIAPVITAQLRTDKSTGDTIVTCECLQYSRIFTTRRKAADALVQHVYERHIDWVD